MLEPETEGVEGEQPSVRRGRTAMQRYRASRPVSVALADGLITKETTFFDYGCGRGGDLKFLSGKCAGVDGWDPEHRPAARVAPADVVNLGYVLNVIENPAERREALKRAFAIARKVLVVSVRVDSVPENFVEFGDGYLTGRETFQKLYTQTEFKEFVQDVLGVRPYVGGLGTVYVFPSQDAEADFIASRAFTRRLEYRTDLIEEFKKSPVARKFVRLANRLGRVPLPEEFKDFGKLADAFGSPQRIERLTLRHINAEAFKGSREQRRDDIITYFAMLRLQGIRPLPFNVLPSTIRQDIKAIWPNYAAAVQDAMEFLFRLGQPDLVKETCRSCGLGKLLPGDLYIHQSIEDDLPALLRLVIFAASSVVGSVEWNIAKIGLDGRTVSFLTYEDFDNVAHPALQRSIRVYLPKASYGIREYSHYANPPVLHRKEAFVTTSYPHYERFRALSDAEEAAGLLSQPNIGTRLEWGEILKGAGWDISGHSLIPRAPTDLGG
ncbi:MAG: DNA phosphorothioation-associated putative methyltransferase [Polyangiaceae bacterium]|nr:DNA phosphorothioation-associated putative methyltransferase [Polyangiaceae bacterium]